MLFSNRKNPKTKIVSEKDAVPELQDGKLYVVSAEKDLVINEVEKAMRHFNMSMDKNSLIYPYGVRSIESIHMVNKSGPLYEAVRQGSNLILPICTPDIEEKKYITAKTGSLPLNLLIPSMVMQAENLTKTAIENALKNLAVQNPEACSSLLHEVFLRKNQSEEKPSEVFFMYSMADSMPMAPSKNSPYKIPSNITYKQSQEYWNRFVKNSNFISKNENAENISEKKKIELLKAIEEVKYVLNDITANDVIGFLAQVDKKTITTFFDCINRSDIAAKSKLKISIEMPKPEVEARFNPKTANKMKTNGKLRVYLTDGKQTVQIQFGRKPSCIIYIMYLLDRKFRGEDIDTLNIINNKDLFCELYGKIYDRTEAQNKYNTLKTRLSDYYMNIRESINEAVSVFNESALPFLIPGEHSHITVLDSNITIPKDFENLKFAY